MRLRRHVAWSRRGVVGPTKKVLELASPWVSPLQGWRKCGRGAGRWDCSYDCVKQLSTRLAPLARSSEGCKLATCCSSSRNWCSSSRPCYAQHERLELRPRASFAVPTGTSPSYLPRLSLCAHRRPPGPLRAYFWDDSSFRSRSSNQSSSSLV